MLAISKHYLSVCLLFCQSFSIQSCSNGIFKYQWFSPSDVITKVMKTNSLNHLQTCSRLWKHMWHLLNRYFDIVKVHTKVFNIAYESYASNKNPMAGSAQLCIDKLCCFAVKTTLTMELFSRRRWRLYQPKWYAVSAQMVSCCVMAAAHPAHTFHIYFTVGPTRMFISLY